MLICCGQYLSGLNIKKKSTFVYFDNLNKKYFQPIYELSASLRQSLNMTTFAFLQY